MTSLGRLNGSTGGPLIGVRSSFSLISISHYLNMSTARHFFCLLCLLLALPAYPKDPANSPPIDMKRLNNTEPVTLGLAAGGPDANCAVAVLGGGRCAVLWLDPSGSLVQSTGSAGGAKWSSPTSVLAEPAVNGFAALTLTGDHLTGWRLAARDQTGTSSIWRVWRRRAWTDAWMREADSATEEQSIEPGRPDGALAWTQSRGTKFMLRPGQRVVGTPPRFPSAGLILSVEEAAGRRDLGFADEMPDIKIDKAALAAVEGHLVVAYIVPGSGPQQVCRVVQLPSKPAASARATWRELPPYPQAPGVAGILSGNHNGVLIAAGGANFPDRPPWEGGKKKYHDSIYVLLPGEKAWRPAGRLPEPRAYAGVVSVPGGVLVAGGENADKVFQDSLLLHWDGRQVVIAQAPGLLAPTTSPVAALLNDKVYLAGGYAPGALRVSRDSFWCLDLADSAAGWKVLPTWPGPTRGQAVLATVGGAVYLISGLEIKPGADGNPQVTYLSDAYRYLPSRAWEKLPDLPWSAIAAPSPAPVMTSPARVFVLGGVDGRQSGKLPRETRLPNDILYFDIAGHQWKLWPEPWPDSVVNVSAVQSGDDWIIVSGEILSGVRTDHAWSWRIEESTDPASPPR